MSKIIRFIRDKTIDGSAQMGHQIIDSPLKFELSMVPREGDTIILPGHPTSEVLWVRWDYKEGATGSHILDAVVICLKQI